MEYTFENEDVVRDYECDIQGIVNNAKYQHYLEHSRHLYVINKGVSFSALHEQEIDVVVAKLEMAFKTPLRPNDHYISRLRVEKNGIRYEFHQAIFRKADNQLCVTAKVTCVAIVNGKLATSTPELDELL